MASSAALTANGIVLGGGAGAAPTTSAVLSNGQMLIGTGGAPTAATLTAGAGIVITNGSGSINVAATADASTKVTKAGDTMTGSLNLGSNTLLASTHVAGSSDASSTPAGGTLRAASGTGTDIPGSALTVQAGNGTGTGGSGAIRFQTAPVAATGSTANTLATAMTITPAGNVGIGFTSPAAKLGVDG